jgi:MSHA pilin protein MshC
MTSQPHIAGVLQRLSKPGLGQRGFTLIELVMVMVLLGVLSVYAAPRVLNTTDFHARGFHEETLSLIRYAQKTAVAQRRTVCVTLTAAAPAKATLSMASVDSSSASSGVCDKAVQGPNLNCVVPGLTGATGCISARSLISYSASPMVVRFDGLGQPLGTALAQVVQVASNNLDISKTLTVEPVTGLVHD